MKRKHRRKHSMNFAKPKRVTATLMIEKNPNDDKQNRILTLMIPSIAISELMMMKVNNHLTDRRWRVNFFVRRD
jgi:hypothetical protein